MFGWSRAGVLCASVALAGGLAYLIWDCVSSSGEKEWEPRRLRPDGEEEQDKAVVAEEAQNAPKSRPVVSGRARVLVLGLDGAGKTSLLHCLATGCLEQDTEPTQGFNAISIETEDLHIELLERACSITDLHDALSLSEVRDRKLFLFSTHVKKTELSSGVQRARDLMIQMVCDSK